MECNSQIMMIISYRISFYRLQISTYITLAQKLPGHPNICRVRLKNDPTSKMWFLGNAWKFLRQIVYVCLAGLWPLMCCFCLKLLYVYEIGITPNFKLEICNCTFLFVMWCYVYNNNYFQVYSRSKCWVILKPHPVHSPRQTALP